MKFSFAEKNYLAILTFFFSNIDNYGEFDIFDNFVVWTIFDIFYVLPAGGRVDAVDASGRLAGDVYPRGQAAEGEGLGPIRVQVSGSSVVEQWRLVAQW